MVMSQKMSAQEYLQDLEKTPIVEAGLDACREIERELMAGDIYAYVSSEEVDEGALGAASITRFSVVIATANLAAASELLKGRFEALVAQEGIGSLNVEAIDLEQESVQCPACGFDGPLEAGQCGDCGLFLGAPE
jgi:hypothetical protein